MKKIMKKNRLIICMLLFLLLGLPIAASDHIEVFKCTVDGVKYRNSYHDYDKYGDWYMHVVGFEYGVKSVIVIPESIMTPYGMFPVEVINKSNFINCGISNADEIKELYLPKTLKTIGCRAFYGCDSLKVVDMGKCDSLKTIEESVFDGCENLKNVQLPSNLRTIGKYAFYGTGLKSVSIPENVREIEEGAFGFCPLDTLHVSPTNPNYELLEDCNVLVETATNTLIAAGEKAMIPTSVQRIGNFAFAGKKDISFTTVPPNVKSIGLGAFNNTSIAEFVLPSSVADSGYVFGKCQNLKRVNILEGRTIIKSSMCDDCYNLKEVQLPSSLLEIGDWAFSDCVSLENVRLPSSLQVIGVRAFDNTGLKTVTLPSSIKKIYQGAFIGCQLKEIVLPAGIEYLAQTVFKGVKLTHIYCLGSNPPKFESEYKSSAESGTFDYSVYHNAIVYVPKGCLDVYKNDENWKKFENIEEKDLSGVSPVIQDSQDNVIYTSSGIQCPEKVENLPSGIYIINGKKKVITNNK